MRFLPLPPGGTPLYDPAKSFREKCELWKRMALLFCCIALAPLSLGVAAEKDENPRTTIANTATSTNESIMGTTNSTSGNTEKPQNPVQANEAKAASGNTVAPATVNDTVLTRLPNGLTVLVKKDTRFPLVSMRLYVHAGSAYETPELAGISHVLEHMVFKGTENYSQEELSATIEAAGGYMNAATSFDYTVYLTDMTKDTWERGMTILKEMAFHALLDETALASEKDVIVAELKRSEDTPGQRLFRMMIADLFHGSAYQHPIIGYEETIRSFTPQMLRDYISRFYHPSNMLLLVAGNVDSDEAMKKAEEVFGGLKNGEILPPELQPAKVSRQTPTVNIETGPWQKVHLALAFPAPALDELQSSQLTLFAHLYGGDVTSHLYRKFKYELRLVDSISMNNYDFAKAGMLFVHVTLDANKLVPFWKEFSKDMATIHNHKFTREQFARARLNIEDSLFRSKETLSGLASKVGYFQFLQGGAQAEKNFLLAIHSTEQAALAALAASIFQPEKAAIVGLLPENAPIADFALPKEASSVTQWLLDEFVRTTGAKVGKVAEIATEKAGEREAFDIGIGRKLILLPDKTLPYVSATLIFSGGDSLLSEKEQGLGALTASVITKGAQGMETKAMQDFLSDRASNLTAASGRQYFSLNVDGPRRFTGDLFKLLRDTVSHPNIWNAELARAQETQVSSIVQAEDSPTGLAFRRLFPFLFPGHSYGFLGLGEKEQVRAFNQTDIRRFWKKQLTQPWVLAVSGDFDREEIIAEARRLPQTATQIPVDPVSWGTDKELVLNLAGRNQAHLFLVFPTAPHGSEDEAGLEVMANALGGQSGILFHDLRSKQGLGYTVSVFPWKGRHAGLMIFYIGTEMDKLTQAEEGFRKAIADIRQAPLPKEDVERAVNQMEGDYYRHRQTLHSRSSEAASLGVLGLSLDAGKELVERARTHTPEDIMALAQKYLMDDKAYIVKVLPVKAGD